jgi:4-hydroxy-2-oxoglutarate aldolase
MFGNVAPAQCIEMLTLVMAGKLKEAQTLQAHLNNADWQILSRGAAGIKAALDLLGYDGGKPRAPSLSMPPGEVAALRAAMSGAGLV